jgi:hypothetical protein
MHPCALHAFSLSPPRCLVAWYNGTTNVALGGSHARCTDLADTSRQYWEDHMHDMTNPETDNPAAYWCAIAKPCTVDHRESLHCGPSDWSIQLLKFCHADLKVSMSNMSRQITMIQRLLLSNIGTLYRSIDFLVNPFRVNETYILLCN